MKKSTLILTCLITGVSLFWYWNKKTEVLPEKDSVSGAYEALSFLAEARIYPNEEIPAEAHFAAWEKMKKSENSNADKRPGMWESMGPHNRAGRILSLAFNPQNPQTLYAGSASGGLWRSYFEGAGENAWEQVPINFPVLGVSSIAIDPNDTLTMYIGTGEVYNSQAAGTGAAYRSTRGSYGMGILKTTDGGLNWTRSLDWAYNQERGIWAVKIAPGNSNLVYAATTEGVYKSTDAGNNWEKSLDVLMATDLLINPVNPLEVVAACGNLGSPGRGIYRTGNGGTDWLEINTTNAFPSDFMGKIQLGDAPSEEQTIYASVGNGFGFDDGASWLIRSDDFGLTWELRSNLDFSEWQGWFAHDVAVFPDNPDEIIVLGVNNYKSDDGGPNLARITNGGIGIYDPPLGGPDGDQFFVHSDAHDVVIQPGTNTVFIASDGGVHASLDRGTSWRSRNSGLQTVQFYNGFSNSVQDSLVAMGGLQDNGTIMWNGDKTWRVVSGGDGSWTAINPWNDQLVYASSQRLNIRMSDDQGENFFGISPNGIDPAAFIAPYIIAADGQTMYAGSSGLNYSEDGGASWNDFPLLIGSPVLSMDVSSTDASKVYFASAPYSGARGQVYISVDGGRSADIITGDLPDRYPMDMAVDPTNDNIAYITFSGFGSGHVFKTTDSGTSWIDISEDLPDVPTNAVVVDPNSPDHIYVGNDLGIFFSSDGGESWESYNEGFPEAMMVFDLKISPSNGKLRAATHGNGAFQRFLESRDFVSVKNLSESNIQTASVFPNPAGNLTQLTFELSEKEKLDIQLADVNGKMLKNIFSGECLSGKNEFEFSISELPGGVYFVRIQGENMTETLSLIKK